MKRSCLLLITLLTASIMHAQSLKIYSVEQNGAYETEADNNGRLPEIEHTIDEQNLINQPHCYLHVKNTSDRSGTVNFKVYALNSFARVATRLSLCYEGICRQLYYGSFDIGSYGDYFGTTDGKPAPNGSSFSISASWKMDVDYDDGVADYKIDFDFGDGDVTTAYVSFVFKTRGSNKVYVTWNESDDGVIVAHANGNVLSNGFAVERGSELTVKATPYDEQAITSLTANGNALANGSTFTINENMRFNAYFAEACTVSWETSDYGHISVTADGNEITNGSKVAKHKTLTILATPYEYGRLETLEVNGQPFENGNDYVVDGDVAISATFSIYYPISWESDNCDIEVTASGNALNNGDEVVKGSKVTITAIPHQSYTLESLTVNGENIENGSSVTIDSETHIVAKASGSGMHSTSHPVAYYDSNTQTLHAHEEAHVTVYDCEGRVWLSRTKIDDGNYSLAGLPTGMYVAKINGQTIKIIK